MQDDRFVDIYTDGACLGNPGPGGWGAVLRYGKHEKELFGSEPDTTTNNRMELMAAIQALKKLKRPSMVRIYTDSAYVKDGITSWLPTWKTNDWRTSAKQPVKNADLWQQLEEAAAPHDVQWFWVKGHAGHPENERADQLAVRGAQEAAGTVAAVPRQAAAPTVRRSARKETGPPPRCQATTRAGTPCQTNAGPSGLCHVHDPALQCGATQKNGKRCTVASGGGRCVHHRGDVDEVIDQGLFSV